MSTVKDVMSWWASLPEAEAKEKAEIMYKVQQQPFEGSGWARRMEALFMTNAKLVYHRPPNTNPGRTGCIEQLINQRKIDETKKLTKACKKDTSHGWFISVKPDKGMGNKARRKPGVYHEWMLRKAKAHEAMVSFL